MNIKTGFTTAIISDQKKFSAVNFFDDYFCLSGKKYAVIGNLGSNDYLIKKSDVKTDIPLTILKVATYMTGIIPLLMLIGKAYVRSKYNFYTKHHESEAAASKVQKHVRRYLAKKAFAKTATKEYLKEHEQDLQEFRQWMTRHKTNYVAHALVSKNFKRVVEDPKGLRCGEDVLRNTGNVEYERGASGKRDVGVLPEVEERHIEILDGLLENLENDNNPFLLNLGFISNSSHPKTWAFLIEQPEFSGQFKDQEILRLEELLAQLFKKDAGNVPDYYMIAYDENRKRRQLEGIDAFFASRREKILDDVGKSCRNQLYLNRFTYLNSSEKMQPQVCFEKCGVRWSYGRHAVLIGNASEKIDQFHRFDNKEECRFPQPFDNGGEFRRAPLKGKDIFVIGPLASYLALNEKINQCRVRYIPFEIMSKEELNFFNVPEKYYSFTADSGFLLERI